MYGLNINDNPIIDTQATGDTDPVEEYLKYKEDIQDVDPINPAMGGEKCSSDTSPLNEYFETSDDFTNNESIRDSKEYGNYREYIDNNPESSIKSPIK